MFQFVYWLTLRSNELMTVMILSAKMKVGSVDENGNCLLTNDEQFEFLYQQMSLFLWCSTFRILFSLRSQASWQQQSILKIKLGTICTFLYLNFDVFALYVHLYFDHRRSMYWVCAGSSVTSYFYILHILKNIWHFKCTATND